MKTCSKCKATHNGSQRWLCPPCKRAYDRERWAAGTPEERQRIMDVKTERIRKLSQRIYDYLLEHPCTDCGEADPVVLEFDHLADKSWAISDMVRRGRAWEKIEEEMAKCEVVCANCHRRRTARRAGWHRHHLVVA